MRLSICILLIQLLIACAEGCGSKHCHLNQTILETRPTTQQSAVELHAVPRWQSVEACSSAQVQICLENHTERNVCVPGQRNPRFPSVLATLDGSVIDFVDRTPYETAGIIRNIAPGGAQINSFDLARLFDMSRPGTYSFVFKATFAMGDYDTRGHWQDTAANVIVVVTTKEMKRVGK